MARTAIMGWDTQDPFAESKNAFFGSGMSIDATIFRSGTASLKAAAVSSTSGRHQISALGLWHRVYLRVTARPATTARTLITFIGLVGDIRLEPNGTLTLHDSVGASVGTSATALTDTTRWYRIEFRTDASTSSLPRVRIEGVDEITAAISTGTGLVYLGPNDTFADTYTAYFDDYVADDTNLPGDGKVVLLNPTSDNTINAWTKPGGGTTNLNTAVDNTPPVGVADSTSVAQAENQIRNPTSNTAYIANMATYSSAGIVAADTINFVRAFVIHAAPVTTGGKVGAIQITANPAEGAAAAFQSATSLYFSGVAAGTHPTGWFRSVSNGAASPSVTLGSSPTVSITISSGTVSRIAMASFIGIYVDYTPAAVTTSTRHFLSIMGAGK